MRGLDRRQDDFPSLPIPTILPTDTGIFDPDPEPSISDPSPSSSGSFSEEQPSSSESASDPPTSDSVSESTVDSTTSSISPSSSSDVLSVVSTPRPSSATTNLPSRPTFTLPNVEFTPQSTPEPEPAKSTPQESLTTSLTVVTTSVSGTLTTYTSAITALVNSSKERAHMEAQQTALIAGLTTGFIVLLLILLGAVFVRRRKTRRQQQEALAAEKKRKESRNLLDAEGFYDDDDPFMSTVNSNRPSYNSRGSAPPRSVSPSPSHLRSRASESGSIFREEVWPPPQDEIVDPIRKGSSQVDLSTIVDHVMGPSQSSGHGRRATESSLNSTRSLIDRHHRASLDSNAFASSSQWADPFQSYPVYSTSNDPISARTSRSISPLPPLNTTPKPSAQSPSYIFPLSDPFSSSSVAHITALGKSHTASASSTTPRPTSVSTPTRSSSPTASVHRLSSQPKTSSPLARALTQDAKLWLTRNPQPTGAKRESQISLHRRGPST